MYGSVNRFAGRLRLLGLCLLSLLRSGSVVTASAASVAARTCLCGLLSLLGSSLLVSLLSLALLETLCDGTADGREDHLDAVLGVVVGRDDEVDVARVGVGIDDGEHGDAKALSLLHGDVLLHHVDDEECARKAGHVGDGAEVLLQLGALATYLQQLALGEVVEGTVIDVKPDEIILNIGYKADGIITKSEYSNDQSLDLTTVVSVGDTMTVKVLKVNDGEGQVLLTYKRLAAEKGNERLREAYENHEVLKATVTQILGGGICTTVDEVRVFIPASLVSDSYEKDLSKYKDQEIQFVISEFNPKRRRIIGDRKQLLVEKKLEQQKELFAKIKVGDVMEGTVKNVTDFGAFIDLGGADGLLHISEMSWGRVENPKKVFTVGEKLNVLIKDIQGEKIALSLKFPETNPWLHADEKYAVGNEVTGKVARMTDFGAFVELEPGVDALLHVSQIAKEHIEKPSDVLKVGQEVTAKVVDFKKDDRKISLSIKALDNE